jgi:leucyl aminopeptidase
MSSLDPSVVPATALPAVAVARTAADPEVVGLAVATSGAVPRQLGMSRAALTSAGFTGAAGQTLVVHRGDGPSLVAVGVGDAAALTPAVLRDAAAAFVRAAGSRARLATNLADLGGIAAPTAGQAVTEGVLLAAYRYSGLKTSTNGTGADRSVTLMVSAERRDGVAAGAERGVVVGGAVGLARDLANTPPAHLTARRIADMAVTIGAATGLAVEIFDEHDLAAMGCGGLLGVNRGSVEPPRLVKLTYSPRAASKHVVLVGKGVMYDSGGLSLKPSDGFHQVMKMDMSGAAAVLATMSTLKALKGRTKVTAYLACTDNMPSGSAMKLGDVLTMRNGKTVEVLNTDAEGRLILADALSLAVEDEPDAIVDIATLTGAALSALGERIAGLLGTAQPWIDAVAGAAERVDEPVWQLPLDTKRYRKLLDSNSADMKNIGGPYGGTITAAIFLSEFVGDVPWAHLDIAGPMKVDADEGWLSKGATGFGTRLLIDLVTAPTR